MPMNRRTRFSRREALSLIGMSAAGVVTGCGPAQSPPPPPATAGTSVPGTPAVSEEAIIRTIKKADVITHEKQKISLMPANLHQALSVQDLADIVSYLSTLRKK